MNDTAEKLERIREEIEANEPKIEVGQYWSLGDKPLRRIRILAKYPFTTEADGPEWIYEECASKMVKLTIGELGRCLEFNLRFVFRPETE